MRRHGLLAAWLYLSLAVWSTWPLARYADQALPLGTEPAATVPLFNLWTLWWNVDRIPHFYRGLWDAPILYPAHDTFAFSESQLTTGLMAAPLWWLTDSPSLTFNVLVLLMLTLNGWSAYRLLRALALRWPAAIAGGACVEMLPFVHWQLGVFQLIPLCGVIWTIHALLQFGRRPNVARGLLLGAAFAYTYLTSHYYGLFLCVLLIAAGGWLCGRQLLRWRMWRDLLPGAVLAAAVMLPVVTVQRRASGRADFVRPRATVQSLSAQPAFYLVSCWPELVPLPDWRSGPDAQYWALSPGTLKLALALLGIGCGLRHRRRRGWTLFGLVLLVLAVLLSLGPRLDWGMFSPYDLLVRYVPGFAPVRNIFRFAVFAQLMVCLLAAGGLQALLVWCRTLWRRGRSHAGNRLDSSSRSACPGGELSGTAGEEPRISRMKRIQEEVEEEAKSRSSGAAAPKSFRRRCTEWLPAVPRVAVIALAIAAVVEVRPPSQRLYVPPRWRPQPSWVEWLKTQTPAGSSIVCLPYVKGTSAAEYEPTTVWMYWGMAHGRPLVNGYTGFFPPDYTEVKAALQKFPDHASVEVLTQRKVRYCVVERSLATEEAIANNPTVWHRLRWVHGDDASKLDIYELPPPPK